MVKHATIDTSIFYERIKIKQGDFEALVKRSEYGKFYATRYTVYELNFGLIQSWVRFYFAAKKIQDPPTAMSNASNLIGRGNKDVSILMSLLGRNEGSIDMSNNAIFLSQIESTISSAIIIFSDLVKGYVGKFGGHPLTSLNGLRSEDYQNFLDLCKDNKIIDIASYFTLKSVELGIIRDFFTEEVKKSNTKLNRSMIANLDIAINQTAKVNMASLNKKYGDVIISIDADMSHTLISKDKLFIVLSAALSKKFILYVS